MSEEKKTRNINHEQLVIKRIGRLVNMAPAKALSRIRSYVDSLFAERIHEQCMGDKAEEIDKIRAAGSQANTERQPGLVYGVHNGPGPF